MQQSGLRVRGTNPTLDAARWKLGTKCRRLIAPAFLSVVRVFLATQVLRMAMAASRGFLGRLDSTAFHFFSSAKGDSPRHHFGRRLCKNVAFLHKSWIMASRCDERDSCLLTLHHAVDSDKQDCRGCRKHQKTALLFICLSPARPPPNYCYENQKQNYGYCSFY